MTSLLSLCSNILTAAPDSLCFVLRLQTRPAITQAVCNQQGAGEHWFS